MFVFTPFVRRVVDLSAGYDYSGTMIAGPLLMLLAPLQDAKRTIFNRRILDTQLTAHFVLCASVIYAVVLSLLNGDWAQAVSGALNMGGTADLWHVAVRRPPQSA